MSQSQQSIICPRCHAETFDNSWKCWRCEKTFPYSLRVRSRPRPDGDVAQRSGCLAVFWKIAKAVFAFFLIVVAIGMLSNALQTPEERVEHDRKVSQAAATNEASRNKTEAEKLKKEQEKSSKKAEYESKKNAMVLHFQTREKTAKDAIWTSDHFFKVGVVDDGSVRDGYAKYVCQVLHDNGFKGETVWVQIIDIVKLTRSGDWEKLGEARCL